MTGHFEVLIKDLLVATEKGQGAGCGKRRDKERQKSGGELHDYCCGGGTGVKAWKIEISLMYIESISCVSCIF